MSKALCICEKPSLMREIKSVYDKIGFKDQIDFVALHGHIVTLYLPEDYDEKYKSWDKTLLPIFPERWRYKETDKKLMKEIKDKLNANKYDYLINATDAEREGQNIFYSIYSYLGLRLPVKRIWLNDLNFEPIKYAIQNMRDDLNEPFLKNLTMAAKTRAVSDWLVGMNFSRATGVRIGRVKTPTLEILYKRELEIRNFVEKIKYRPIANIGIEIRNDEEFDSDQDCKEFIKNEIFKGNEIANGKVNKFETKGSKKYAPLLFSLGELQAEANAVHGYTLDKTLELAQSLYEKKITTYPRTDCPYLPSGDAARITSMIPLLKSIVGNVDLETNTIPSKYIDDSKVQAHGAIILTGSKFNMNDLSDEEKNIVILISERILATMMKPMVTYKTNVEIDIEGHIFTGSGTDVRDEGYRALYADRMKFSHDMVGPLKAGQLVRFKNIVPKEFKNSKPKRYTDGTLIKAMINIGNTLSEHDKQILKGTGDQGGIGTPATRSNIVEELLQKNGQRDAWIYRKKKEFYVSDDGMAVGEKLKDYSFASASLTASWEEKLSQIVDGKYNGVQYYKEMKEYIMSETDNLKNTYTNYQNDLNVKCPKCGKPMKIGKNCYYCSGKSDESCDIVFGKVIAGANIDTEAIKAICEGKETKALFMTSKTGKKFKAKLIYNKQENKLDFKFDNGSNKSFGNNKASSKSSNYKPKQSSGNNSSNGTNCGCGGKIVKLKGQYGDFYKCEKCGKTVGANYCGRDISLNEASELFSGNEVHGKFYSKAKKKYFDANIFLSEDDSKIKFDFDN